MLTTRPYGTTTDGRAVQLYALRNAHGMALAVTEVGASIVSVQVPDAGGNLVDVALGYDDSYGYEHNDCLMGATVGRVANRTAGAAFELDGHLYHLVPNEGANNNHSGPDLWSTRVWQLAEATDERVTFTLSSHEGDQGFPGTVEMHVSYQLTEDDRIVVTHEGVPTARTPMNLTNHTYWNLNGHASGSTLGHTLCVNAGRYLPTTEANIPTGELAEVAGTPFDLQNPTLLAVVTDALPYGIDHCYCLEAKGALAHVARLCGSTTGIVLDVLTDAPGLQVYMAGWLDVLQAKDGARYGQFGGVALEAQHWPDSVHHADWPSVIYGPGRPFDQTIIFAFSNA